MSHLWRCSLGGVGIKHFREANRFLVSNGSQENRFQESLASTGHCTNILSSLPLSFNRDNNILNKSKALCA